MRITYTNYPLSEKLTNKSMRVATLTQPIYGITLGAIPGLVSAFLFSDSVAIPMTVLGIGVVACPILLSVYRKKKFAQYDEEYKQICQNSQK